MVHKFLHEGPNEKKIMKLYNMLWRIPCVFQTHMMFALCFFSCLISNKSLLIHVFLWNRGVAMSCTLLIWTMPKISLKRTTKSSFVRTKERLRVSEILAYHSCFVCELYVDSDAAYIGAKIYVMLLCMWWLAYFAVKWFYCGLIIFLSFHQVLNTYISQI
jgi:hypothetical protein